MRTDLRFLGAFVERFKLNADEDWMRMQMQNVAIQSPDTDDDPAFLHTSLQKNLERIFVPSQESMRIAKWIYQIARGFVLYRYRSPQEYVDICMKPVSGINRYSCQNIQKADEVPIYAVDGLPGVGKSALFKALSKLFPPPMQIAGAGNPPQMVQTISAVWVSVSSTFSLKDWMMDALLELGTDPARIKGYKTIPLLSELLYKAMYRAGVGAILVDELQFASGVTSSQKALGHILSMRHLGVPIVFFANTDFLENIRKSPAQVSQRVPRTHETFMPLLRTSPVFKQILTAQLDLVPFGHSIDIARESINIYDMVAGSPRGTGRLIDIACATSIYERRKLTLQDLVEARRTSSFDSMRDHIALLSATAPVNPKRHPELSSNNRQFDAESAYLQQLANQRIEDAAATAWYSSLSSSEQEAVRAAETKILRDSGKIPDNISALGESRKLRKTRNPDNTLQSSYAAQKMASFNPKNPIAKDPDASEK
jgi:hypothetical protein